MHPWLLVTSNQRRDAAQLRAVRIPDVPAGALIAQGGSDLAHSTASRGADSAASKAAGNADTKRNNGSEADPSEKSARTQGSLGMMSGDFVAVCGSQEQRGQWDAVLTCFFIDTAHNVLQYLEARILLGLSTKRMLRWRCWRGDARFNLLLSVTCTAIDEALHFLLPCRLARNLFPLHVRCAPLGSLVSARTTDFNSCAAGDPPRAAAWRPMAEPWPPPLPLGCQRPRP